MKLRAYTLSLALSLFACAPALAQDTTAGALRIAQPWARATVAGQPAGGGFLAIANSGAADRLLAVHADVSATVELHTMSMDGDVMRMREVEAIAVPANGKLELKPGGYHIMFMKLKAPLKEGARFPATLVFEKAGEVKVDFSVRAIGASAGDAGHGAHGHHQHEAGGHKH